MCINMCIDICTDMFTNMCIGMCIDMWTDMYMAVCSVSLTLPSPHTDIQTQHEASTTHLLMIYRFVVSLVLKYLITMLMSGHDNLGQATTLLASGHNYFNVSGIKGQYCLRPMRPKLIILGCGNDVRCTMHHMQCTMSRV